MNKIFSQPSFSLFSFCSILIVGGLLFVGIVSCQQDQQGRQEQLAITTASDKKGGTSSTAIVTGNEAVAPSAKFVVYKPFEEIIEASEEVLIKKPAQAQKLNLKDGAYIKIPAYAFRNAAGDTIKEMVRLKYTGLHDIASIIASGVPMKYTHEDGTVEWMKTGGMFEIEGYTENGPVELFEGKAMEVSFVSDKPGQFDFWSFNQATDNWNNLAQDQQPQREALVNEQLEREIQSLENATSKSPINPEVGATLIFTDLNLDKCPELKGTSPLALKYAGTDQSKDPKETGILEPSKVWYKKELKPLGAGTYELTLYGDERYTIPVKVALEGTDLEKAKERYRALLAKYQQNISLLKNKKALRQQQEAFRRTIAVAEFGVFNYDILVGKSNARSLKADFNFGDTYNSVKEEIPVYLVTGEKDMVVKLPKRDWKDFWYQPSWDNQLIAVLPGDKVATFSKKNFEEAAAAMEAAGGGEYVFEMDVQDKRINTIADLQSILDEGTDLADRGQTTQLAAPDIKLFPNPAVDRLNVDLSSLSGKSGRLRLMSNTGQLVKELPLATIGTEPIFFQFGPLDSGPYYLTVIADGRSVVTEKVMIQ